MTITSTVAAAIPRNRFACNGATVAFNIVDSDSSPVIVCANSEIRVWHYDDTDDSISLLVEGVDYTLSGLPSSGVITTTATYPTGDYIAFERRVASSQDTNLNVSGQYEPTVMMGLSGKDRQLDQDILSMALRAVKKHPVFGGHDNESVELPYAPGKVMVGSSDGGLEASTLTATQLAAIETNAAASAAAASTSETNAAASAAAASTSEGNASTSAAAAAASAAAALTSEGNASTSATAAAASALAAAAASENLGFTYTFDSSLSGDPGTAKFGFDSLTFASITTLRINETSGAEGDISGLMAVWDDSSSAIKATVRVRNPATPTQWMEFYITGSRTDNGDYSSFPVSPIAISNGTQTTDALADETGVIFGVFRNGDAGTGAVDSWNGRTGSVLPAAGDYDDNQITAAGSATNYTPSAAHVEGHLAGIDTELGLAPRLASANVFTNAQQEISAGAGGVLAIWNANAGTARRARISTAGSTRWQFGADNVAEGGSDAGSDFFIERFNDSGVSQGIPFSIDRATGQVSISNLALTAISGGNAVTTDTDQEVTGDKVFSGSVSADPDTASSSSGSLTLNFSICNVIKVTLTENVTSVSITAPPDADGITDLYVIFTNGSGPYSVTGWPAAVHWDSNGEPDLTTTLNGNRCKVQMTYDGTVYMAAASSNHGATA